MFLIVISVFLLVSKLEVLNHYGRVNLAVLLLIEGVTIRGAVALYSFDGLEFFSDEGSLVNVHVNFNFTLRAHLPKVRRQLSI